MSLKKESSHESYDRKEKFKVGSDRTFGVVFAVVFFALATSPLFLSKITRGVLILSSILFLATALLDPSKLNKLNVLWAKFGIMLGKFISPVILGLLYFTAFVPTGLLLRLFRKDILKLKIDNKANTYWINSPTAAAMNADGSPGTSSMKDQF